jgi:hypothetical protein
LTAKPSGSVLGSVPFPTEAARDVLGLLRAMYRAEEDPHRRRTLAHAGHQVRTALELAETNPDQAHAMVNIALRTVQESMRYFEPFAPIFAAALDRVRAK